MLIEGPGLYYDGRSARGVPVRFVLDLARLELAGPGGAVLASWPVARLRRRDSAPGQLRLSPDGEDACLEVVDPVAFGALGPALRALPSGSGGTGAGLRVAAWLVAALASVVVLVWFGIPALADRIAPLVPVSVEQRLGESVKPQVLASLSGGRAAPRVCRAEAGAAALDRLVRPFAAAAEAPMPIAVEVVDLKLANAFALPGGQVVLTRGLIDRLGGPDELAGILAHEFGHVVHRDAMRGLIKSAGLSLVIGVVIGDFTGSTIAVAVGRVLVDAGYSREAEALADAYAVGLMRRVGRDPAALGTALETIARDGPALDGLLSWFSTHPEPAERARRLKRETAPGAAAGALIDPADWAALEAICR